MIRCARTGILRCLFLPVVLASLATAVWLSGCGMGVTSSTLIPAGSAVATTVPPSSTTAVGDGATTSRPSTASTEPVTSTTESFPPLPESARAIRVPILMYHLIDSHAPTGPYGPGLTVSPQTFEEEMRFLEEGGYHSVTFAGLYAALAGTRPLPAKPVLLTFDDGNRDNYSVAFPILRRHHLVATFFVVTKMVGRPPALTWQQLSEMSGAGMTVASHTVSHLDLRTLSSGRLRYELIDSRAKIAAELGTAPVVLSYPSGEYDRRVEAAAAKAGYVMAVTTHSGRRIDPQRLLALPRVRVPGGLSLQGFIRALR